MVVLLALSAWPSPARPCSLAGEPPFLWPENGEFLPANGRIAVSWRSDPDDFMKLGPSLTGGGALRLAAAYQNRDEWQLVLAPERALRPGERTRLVFAVPPSHDWYYPPLEWKVGEADVSAPRFPADPVVLDTSLGGYCGANSATLGPAPEDDRWGPMVLVELSSDAGVERRLVRPRGGQVELDRDLFLATGEGYAVKLTALDLAGNAAVAPALTLRMPARWLSDLGDGVLTLLYGAAMGNLGDLGVLALLVALVAVGAVLLARRGGGAGTRGRAAC